MERSTFSATEWLRPLLLGGAILVLLLQPARGFAADPLTEARNLFTQAQKLYDEGKYADAADRYTAVYRMIQSPLVLFNVAQARRLQFQQDGDYRHLVEARTQYEKFLAEANPSPADRQRAEVNLEEVKKVSLEEAKKNFTKAEESMRLGRYEAAIAGYEAAYELSKRTGILFNLAQAQRKQFQVDRQLDRLARAEDLLLSYRRESQGRVDPQVIEELLTEIRTQRAEYHRRRDAEARAKEPQAMRDAREAYQRGDAEAALKFLTRAESIKGNERVVLLQIYRLRGQAAAMAGNGELAVESFKRYLALEPAADGTGISDDAVAAFQAAKTFWKGKQPLKLEHLAPGKVAPKKPVSIPVKVASDPLQMVKGRELRYRRQGFKDWEVVLLAGADPAANLPPTPPPVVGNEYQMEYFILAKDANQGVLDTLGSPTAPLAFLVTNDAIVRPTPVYKKWWFWAATGAVVVGTVTTIAIIQADGLPDNPVTGDVSQGLIRF